jgi:hypothetical protein
MPTLKCTKKVQTYLNLKPIDLAEPVQNEEGLGAWYVNLFYVDRQKCIVFMNEKTLLSFLLFGFDRASSPKEELPEQCINGIIQLLTMEDFPNDSIGALLTYSQNFRYMKTTDRKTLGNMNDLIYLYESMILAQGGLQYCDLTGIIREINRTPQRNIDWEYPIDKAKVVLGEIAYKLKNHVIVH